MERRGNNILLFPLLHARCALCFRCALCCPFSGFSPVFRRSAPFFVFESAPGFPGAVSSAKDAALLPGMVCAFPLIP